MQSAGIYWAHPTSAILGETSTGKSEVAITIEVVKYAVGGGWEQITPAMQRTMKLSLEGKAYDHTVKKLASLGWDQKDFGNIALSRDTLEAGIEVECIHEENKSNGRVYEKWQLPFTGGPKIIPAGQDRIMKLNAKLQQKQYVAPPSPAKPAAAPSGPPKSAPPASGLPSPLGAAKTAGVKDEGTAWAYVLAHLKNEEKATAAWLLAKEQFMGDLSASGPVPDPTEWTADNWILIAANAAAKK